MAGPDPRLVASFGVAIAFDVLMPLVLVLVARRRWGFAWRTVGIGALAFALSQLFTRLPVVQALQYLLRGPLQDSAPLRQLWIAGLSLTAGLFEETARWWAFQRPLRHARRWRDAVGFGLGHGGLESAVLIAGLTVLGLVNAVVLARMDPSTLPLPPEQLDQVRAAQAQMAAMRWWEPLLGAYERLAAMGIHVAMSVWVLRGVVSGRRGWYGAAVLFHAVSNWAAVTVASMGGVVAAEAVVTAFALVALTVAWRARDQKESC
jgi:uncharacterized membrane protein YhfC